MRPSLARKLWLETHPLAASADVLGDNSEQPGAANDKVTAMSRQQREPGYDALKRLDSMSLASTRQRNSGESGGGERSGVQPVSFSSV